MTITTTKLTRAAGLVRRRRGAAVHRRPDQAPPPGRHLHHHDRVRGPRNHEDLHGRLLADRYHRDLPAPGQADRSARPDRVRRTSASATSPSLSVQIDRCVRPARPCGQPARLRQRRPRRGDQRHPGRRRRPDCRSSSRVAASPTSSAASSSASPSSGPDVLARWAAALLSVGAVAILATSLLPELTQRLFAIPVSVALIGLGYSLWREQRTQKTQSLSSPVSSQLDPTGAK